MRMDNSGYMGIDKSIKVRVQIGVRKPLMRKLKIKIRGGNKEFFDVKYEKPPLFCFCCGLIMHGLKDCNEYKEEDDDAL
ncbi:Primosomal protein N' [Bienertia sinuspersici]